MNKEENFQNTVYWRVVRSLNPRSLLSTPLIGEGHVRSKCVLVVTPIHIW